MRINISRQNTKNYLAFVCNTFSEMFRAFAVFLFIPIFDPYGPGSKLQLTNGVFGLRNVIKMTEKEENWQSKIYSSWS